MRVFHYGKTVESIYPQPKKLTACDIALLMGMLRHCPTTKKKRFQYMCTDSFAPKSGRVVVDRIEMTDHTPFPTLQVWFAVDGKKVKKCLQILSAEQAQWAQYTTIIKNGVMLDIILSLDEDKSVRLTNQGRQVPKGLSIDSTKDMLLIVEKYLHALAQSLLA